MEQEAFVDAAPLILFPQTLHSHSDVANANADADAQQKFKKVVRQTLICCGAS